MLTNSFLSIPFLSLLCSSLIPCQFLIFISSFLLCLLIHPHSGCVGSVGSIGCVGSVGSIGSIASLSSIGSFTSVSAVGGIGFLVVLMSWLISLLQCHEANSVSVWCTNWFLFCHTATRLRSRAAHAMSLYISAMKSGTTLIYSTAVLLLLCVFITVIRRRWNLGSKFSYPLNCVHGYVNLDGEGNILSRDSQEAPRSDKQ